MFENAKKKTKKVKIMVWGESGAGKTSLALQFPKPCVIDLEHGTDLYGGKFDFDVLHASTADEVEAAVDYLEKTPGKYETIVVDPISIFWDAIQKKWSDIMLVRNKSSRGFKTEFYDMQARDWMVVKADYKDFLRKLLALDMNIVVTAQAKTAFAMDGSTGIETYAGEKSLQYSFDIVLRLFRNAAGEPLAECIKDRSGTLPVGRSKAFPAEYTTIQNKLIAGRKEDDDPRRLTQVSECGITGLFLASDKATVLVEADNGQTFETTTEVGQKLKDAMAQGVKQFSFALNKKNQILEVQQKTNQTQKEVENVQN